LNLYATAKDSRGVKQYYYVSATKPLSSAFKGFSSPEGEPEDRCRVL